MKRGHLGLSPCPQEANLLHHNMLALNTAESWVLVRPELKSRPPAWQPNARPSEPPVHGDLKISTFKMAAYITATTIRLINQMKAGIGQSKYRYKKYIFACFISSAFNLLDFHQYFLINFDWSRSSLIQLIVHGLLKLLKSQNLNFNTYHCCSCYLVLWCCSFDVSIPTWMPLNPTKRWTHNQFFIFCLNVVLLTICENLGVISMYCLLGRHGGYQTCFRP